MVFQFGKFVVGGGVGGSDCQAGGGLDDTEKLEVLDGEHEVQHEELNLAVGVSQSRLPNLIKFSPIVSEDAMGGGS